MAPQNDPLIGQVLSERYRVLERIGRGGFGAVYRVQHIKLDKILALKVLFDRTGENPRMIKRFEREARAACRIGHENIVEITDFARFGENSYYFVMEYLEGETLGRRIKRMGPLSPDRLVHVGSQIADALSATHQKGIIHRDLKPDNVLLTRRRNDPDFVKVLDFGIAAMMEPGEHAPGLTDHGAMLGTPAYMSPEQATGLPATAQSDVYALGILLYEMATGSVPFRDQNAMSVLEMHRAREPVPPRKARPDLDIHAPIEAIIMRALRKPLSQRYATMREVYNDLVVAVGERISVLTEGDPTIERDPMREPIEWLEAEEALVLLEAGDTVGHTAPLPKRASRAAERPAPPPMVDDEPTFARPALPLTPPAEVVPRPEPVQIALRASTTGPTATLGEAPTAPKAPPPKRPGTQRISPTRPVAHRPPALAALGFVLAIALYAAVSAAVNRGAPPPAPDPDAPATVAAATPPAAPPTVVAPPAEAAAPAAPTVSTPPRVEVVSAPREAEPEGTALQRRAPTTPPEQPARGMEVEDSAMRRGVVTNTESVRIAVRSTPPGARVAFLDQELVTPCEVVLPRGAKNLPLALSLDGYAKVETKVSGTNTRALDVKLRKKGGGRRGDSGEGYDKW